MTLDPPAVIGLGPGNYEVDWATLFRDMLRNNWNSQNTDSSKPDVMLQEDMGQARFAQDTITIYTVTDPSQILTIGNFYKHQTIILTFTFFTKGDRKHLYRVTGEAERIVQANNVDTVNSDLVNTKIGGRVWTQWGIRSIRGDRNTNGFYKAEIDAQINWRFKNVVGPR